MTLFNLFKTYNITQLSFKEIRRLKVRNDSRSIAFNVVQRAFLKTVLLKSLLFGVKDSSKVVVSGVDDGLDLNQRPSGYEPDARTFLPVK